MRVCVPLALSVCVCVFVQPALVVSGQARDTSTTRSRVVLGLLSRLGITLAEPAVAVVNETAVATNSEYADFQRCQALLCVFIGVLIIAYVLVWGIYY